MHTHPAADFLWRDIWSWRRGIGLDWIESAKGFDSGIAYVEIIRFAQDDSRSVREKTVRREVDGKYTEL
jgi:hypothetical protein